MYRLFNVYIQSTDHVQRLIRQHIYNLIKSIGMHSPKLLDVIRNFPSGGETLVIRILVTLCDTGMYMVDETIDKLLTLRI